MLKFIIIILSLFTLTFCDNISAKNDIEIYQSENIVIESTSKVSDELREGNTKLNKGNSGIVFMHFACAPLMWDLAGNTCS